jgi:hypothetical protein
MKKGLSAALQFVLGFLLGIAILAGGAAAVGYFIFSRMASPPNKPIFAEELKEKPVATTAKVKPIDPSANPGKSTDKSTNKTSAGNKADDSKNKPKTTDSTPAKANAQPSPSPSTPLTQPDANKNPAPTQSPEPEQAVPKGAYKGKVTWSSGLSLRADPNTSASRVGGVDYNSELIILETSKDGQWQKVRVANGTQEGWVKAGNVKKSAQ